MNDIFENRMLKQKWYCERTELTLHVIILLYAFGNTQ